METKPALGDRVKIRGVHIGYVRATCGLESKSLIQNERDPKNWHGWTPWEELEVIPPLEEKTPEEKKE